MAMSVQGTNFEALTVNKHLGSIKGRNPATERIIESLWEYIPLLGETQIIEKYRKTFGQLASFSELFERQFIGYVQEVLKPFKLKHLQLEPDRLWGVIKSLLRGFCIKLNSSDIKILRALHLNPLLTLEGICSATRLSWGTVQKRYNKLTKGNAYRVIAVPNYEKLGLVPVLVITTDNERKIYSKYLTEVQKSNGWFNSSRLWEMLIPKSKVEECKRVIFRYLRNSLIFEKTFIANNVNFAYYDAKNKSWKINWLRWELELERKEKIKEPTSREKQTGKKRKIKKTDLGILFHLTENLRREQREIAIKLNTSESKVSLCKKVLLDEGYFTPITQLTERGGLTENLLIIYDGEIKEIPTAFLKLPQVTIHSLINHNHRAKQTAIQIKLPPGSKTRIKKILERKYPNIQFSDYTINATRFPESILEMFDEKNQRWKWTPLSLKIYHEPVKTKWRQSEHLLENASSGSQVASF
ncbi:MAG: winged helix-turn-helix transcriptional regulator [Candidatus Freyarchaeota archaeon]